MTLFSGKNVAVPFDTTGDSHNANFNPIYNNSVSPTVGDTYQFFVTYSDGTTGIVSGQVTAVLTSFAQNLVMSPTPSRNIPTLTWTAPASPPAGFYSYSVGLYGPSEQWNYSGGNNSNGIPSTQTSVLFNVDNSASSPSLTTGVTYNWYVQVDDTNGNSAQFTTTYIP